MISSHLICIASALPNDASALESAISALESAVTALDKSSGFWERLLPWFTGFVVVGVAAEIWVVAREYNHSIAAWSRGIIRPAGRPLRFDLALGLIASILITLGVFGELAVGIEIARINGQLRTKNAELRGKTDQLTALLNAKAGAAERAAAAAQERTAKIEASMMLRELPQKAKVALCSAIHGPFANMINVSSSSQDWEAMRYAGEFLEAVNRCAAASGLHPSAGMVNLFWTWGDVPFGVWIKYTKNPGGTDLPNSSDLRFNLGKRQALARKIFKALQMNGVKVEGISDKDQHGLIDIYVGPRLPPQVDAQGATHSKITSTSSARD